MYVSDSATPINTPAEGDMQRHEYILGVKLCRKINNKEQRIVIMRRCRFYVVQVWWRGKIGLGLYSWLVNNEYPVYTEWIKVKDNKLTIGKDAAKMLRYVYLWILFRVLLLVTGTIILIRRKRSKAGKTILSKGRLQI